MVSGFWSLEGPQVRATIAREVSETGYSCNTPGLLNRSLQASSQICFPNRRVAALAPHGGVGTAIGPSTSPDIIRAITVTDQWVRHSQHPSLPVCSLKDIPWHRFLSSTGKGNVSSFGVNEIFSKVQKYPLFVRQCCKMWSVLISGVLNIKYRFCLQMHIAKIIMFSIL